MDNFLGEIRLVPFTFAPSGWADCNGQLLSISQNSALYSLLGTTYGGNGVQTFGLPNLQGRLAIHTGQLPGGSSYVLGQTGGSENVTLNLNQIPSHTHNLNASDQSATQGAPNPNYLPSNGTRGAPLYAGSVGTLQPMNQASIGPAGGSQSHNNLEPFLVLRYIIALQGIFPSRS